MASEFIWQRTRPQSPGWYWWKGETEHEGEIIEVFVQSREGVDELRAWVPRNEQSFPLETIKGEFAGPLPLPTGTAKS